MKLIDVIASLKTALNESEKYLPQMANHNLLHFEYRWFAHELSQRLEKIEETTKNNPDIEANKEQLQTIIDLLQERDTLVMQTDAEPDRNTSSSTFLLIRSMANILSTPTGIHALFLENMRLFKENKQPSTEKLVELAAMPRQNWVISTKANKIQFSPASLLGQPGEARLKQRLADKFKQLPLELRLSWIEQQTTLKRRLSHVLELTDQFVTMQHVVSALKILRKHDWQPLLKFLATIKEENAVSNKLFELICGNKTIDQAVKTVSINLTGHDAEDRALLAALVMAYRTTVKGCDDLSEPADNVNQPSSLERSCLPSPLPPKPPTSHIQSVATFFYGYDKAYKYDAALHFFNFLASNHPLGDFERYKPEVKNSYEPAFNDARLAGLIPSTLKSIVDLAKKSADLDRARRVEMSS